jgi:hypothetical protein
MNVHSHTACSVLCAAMLCAAGDALAADPEGSNLLGQRGLLRVSTALPQPAGVISIGTDFQFFKASGFLSANQDHSRMVNTYALNWAPFRFVEAAFAMHVTSDNSVTGAVEELQVAVGDPELALKGGAELGAGFALGGLLDLRFPSGAGFFQSSASATNVLIALLATWSGGSKLPLGVHLNFGFLRDGSASLFPDPGKLTPAQRYAAQVSSFNRLITRLGFEYVTRYVGPFLELSLEPFVGGDNPGFGNSPGVLSLGARAWPTKHKGLQMMVAADIGITGVGDGAATVTAPGKYAFVIPRWNLLLQLSYRFDAYAGPEVRVVSGGGRDGDGSKPPPAAKQGVIVGSVVDERTDKPVWNARVSLAGDQTSSLAVSPQDGSFRSYKVPAGKHTLVVSADGYAQARLEVEVPADGQAEAKLRLAPRASIVPGTLRGTIKSLQGKLLPGATVLIPEIDKTIEAGADGTFSVALKPGEYKVVVSAKGYRSQTKNIRILEGDTVIWNVDLHR